MLTIRTAQMESLEHEMNLLWFEAHLSHHFPTLKGSLPNGAMRSFVTTGLEHAKEHGFVSMSEQTHWLNVAALLGPEFDRDGGLPWVGPILAAPESNFARIQHLLQAVEQNVFGGGPDGK